MRIGIIGAGQLGQMLGFAAAELDTECRFVDPSDAPPASQAGTVIQSPFDDAQALAALARDCDVVTYEFENVPVDALLPLCDQVPVYPPPEALRHAQDRLTEKRLFDSLGIPLPGYRKIDSEEDLRDAAATIGLPLVVKTRRFGYDGKGQAVVRSEDDIHPAWQALCGSPLIAEAWVDFDYEVSAIGARNARGETVIYPLTRNDHSDGILRQSRAPAEATGLEQVAQQYMQALLDHLDYVGVLALELFVCGDRLLANEFAPRVHNSGHWTIEGAETSQFANHILAVSGQPLGATACKGHAGMINLIGTIPDAARDLRYENCWLHDYGKDPRPGRKLGHVTVLAESAALRDERMTAIAGSFEEL
jgi:5-(carboxyamino)imidazole ribonucleotide synthase